MENEFFLLNAGIQPPLQFQPAPSMPTWNSLSSAMETQAAELNCFLNPTWEKSTDQSVHFDSALSSMVSSPAASNSNVSNESFVIRELIGKLGNIGNSPEISPHSHPLQGNGSIYSTPLNSPPKLNFPITDQERKIPSLGKSMASNSSVAEFSSDPGFAERAARFSCFGSRSFNGRTSQVGLNNGELQHRSNPLMENGEIQRVSSSPSLKALGSQLGVQQNNNSPIQNQTEFGNSQEESAGSEQFPTRENGLKASNDLNSRKRKTVPRGKVASPPAIAAKVSEDDDNSNAKRSKVSEINGNENSPVKAEEEPKGSPNQKPPEPPKDYIHVRARRGQATDSHSLAERVRREKISERMKLLQDLVPGCNKVTGKALMLDEIINYVQSLQRQVEFLSMKLASVNTRLDFNMDSLTTKDIFQSNNPSPHPIFPIDSSAPAFYGHRYQQNQGPALHSNICNGTVSSVDPLDAALCRNLSMQLPPLDGFGEGVPQYPTFCEDDLQTIVQMGFGQNLNPETVLQSQSFHAQNQGSHTKTEL